jgi:hypothetical protein
MGQRVIATVKIFVCVQQYRITHQNFVPVIQYCAINDFMLIDEYSMLAFHSKDFAFHGLSCIDLL